MENTKMTQKLRACRDSEGLGTRRFDRFIVGYTSEVNGPDSAEIPDFVPTRHELVELVKHWAKLILEQQFFFFLYGQTGSSEGRRYAFAYRRIGRIETLLGEEEVRKAVLEAEENFSKGTDPRAWAIFQNGTPEEQTAFRIEVLRKFDEDVQDDSSQADGHSEAE